MSKLIVSMAVLLAFLLAACEKQEKPLISLPDDYQSWHQPLPAPVEYPIPGHGASRRIIFANGLALQARILKNENNNTYVSYPDGSILVKEVYKRKGNSYEINPQLTIMIKDKSNKNALGGWLYYVRNPGNSQLVLITNRTCMGCHEAANEAHPYFDKNPQGIFRDYVFVNLAR